MAISGLRRDHGKTTWVWKGHRSKYSTRRCWKRRAWAQAMVHRPSRGRQENSKQCTAFRWLRLRQAARRVGHEVTSPGDSGGVRKPIRPEPPRGWTEKYLPHVEHSTKENGRRGPSTSQPQRATIEPTYVGILMRSSDCRSHRVSHVVGPPSATATKQSSPNSGRSANKHQRARHRRPNQSQFRRTNRYGMEKETTSIHDMLPGTLPADCSRQRLFASVTQKGSTANFRPHLPDDGHPLQSNICLTVGTRKRMLGLDPRHVQQASHSWTYGKATATPAE